MSYEFLVNDIRLMTYNLQLITYNMRILFYILQKEFIQIFRNKGMLPIIFVLPMVQMLILVFAATFEIKQVDMMIVDLDHSPASRQLTNQIMGNKLFRMNAFPTSATEAEQMIQASKSDLALVIPRDFDKKITLHQNPDVQILVDAINGNAAQLGSAYLSNIIRDFHKSILMQQKVAGAPEASVVEIESSFWYNPTLNYRHYMAPGILVVLITVIGMFLGSMNLVREKELGTIEQINVTPIKKWQFIAGKLMPFLLIGLFELIFGLTLAKIVFNIPFVGSFPLLFGISAVYLVLVLSAGLYFSTISDTQQQVTFVVYFLMMVFLLMSGLFTPVESMPTWAQNIDRFNPLFYFVRIMRGIVLKGAGISEIFNDFLALLAYAVGMFSLAIWRYRKTS